MVDIGLKMIIKKDFREKGRLRSLARTTRAWDLDSWETKAFSYEIESLAMKSGIMETIQNIKILTLALMFPSNTIFRYNIINIKILNSDIFWLCCNSNNALGWFEAITVLPN